MKLSAEEWRRVNEIFHQALELPESERAEFITSVLPDAPHLRAEVESLLSHFDGSTDFLEKPAAAQFASSLSEALPNAGYAAGDRIDDFVLIRQLGSGAFATVWLAHQSSLNRPVALKISPDFGDEARTMASLEHQHIVKVFSETREPYRNARLLCMQYVAGASLARIIESVPEGRPLSGAEILYQLDSLQLGDTLFDPAALKDRETLQGLDGVSTVAWVGMRMAEALAYAHESGVLHLDVKPANILINTYGQPMLTDFNVAVRSRALEERKQTILGGTLDYMAPEHRRIFEKAGHGGRGAAPSFACTERIDQRADIYSLGLVLRQMLEKAAPGADTSVARDREPLEAILECCLREDPRQRFSSVTKLVRALEGFLDLRTVEKALPPAGPVTRLTWKRPILAFTFFTMLPHVFGSLVNISYNYLRIVSALSPSQQQLFRSLCLVYNIAVYPLCIALIVLLVLPMVRVLWHPPLCFDDPDSARRRRTQALHLPLRMAAVAALGWMPGSLFFPAALDWLEGPLPPGVYGHFFISFTLSCLIAMSYSFLYLQFVVLRIIYPRLCCGETNIRETARRELALLGPTLRLFHFSAGLVPLIGAALVVGFGPERLDAQHYAVYRWLVSFLLLIATCGIFSAVRATQLLSQCLFALTGIG